MMNEAKNLFEQYIFSQVATIPNLTQVPLEKTGLVNEYFLSMEQTHFDDRYDTLIYSELGKRNATTVIGQKPLRNWVYTEVIFIICGMISD